MATPSSHGRPYRECSAVNRSCPGLLRPPRFNPTLIGGASKHHQQSGISSRKQKQHYRGRHWFQPLARRRFFVPFSSGAVQRPLTGCLSLMVAPETSQKYSLKARTTPQSACRLACHQLFHISAHRCACHSLYPGQVALQIACIRVNWRILHLELLTIHLHRTLAEDQLNPGTYALSEANHQFHLCQGEEE